MRLRETAYLFTDARYEHECGGLGAVLFNDKGKVISWFGQSLGRSECASLNVSNKDQIITELEALAILAILRHWRDLLVQRHLLVFVDNEGARVG